LNQKFKKAKIWKQNKTKQNTKRICSRYECLTGERSMVTCQVVGWLWDLCQSGV